MKKITIKNLKNAFETLETLKRLKGDEMTGRQLTAFSDALRYLSDEIENARRVDLREKIEEIKLGPEKLAEILGDYLGEKVEASSCSYYCDLYERLTFGDPAAVGYYYTIDLEAENIHPDGARFVVITQKEGGLTLFPRCLWSDQLTIE